MRHIGWDAYRLSGAISGRLVLFTTAADVDLWNFDFAVDDRLMFGRESAGVPEEIHEAVDVRVRIPLAPGARSLNVVTAAAIALAEAARQHGGALTAQRFSRR